MHSRVLPPLINARFCAENLYFVTELTELTKHSRQKHLDNSQLYIQQHWEGICYLDFQGTRVQVKWWWVQWWKMQHLVRKKEESEENTSDKTILIECVYVLVCVNVSHLLLYWSLKYLIERLRALVSYKWSFLRIFVCLCCLFSQI